MNILLYKGKFDVKILILNLLTNLMILFNPQNLQYEFIEFQMICFFIENLKL